ncbi:hypothetical protein BH09DEP1_BH09DEP1_8170 [soil metagenome]
MNRIIFLLLISNAIFGMQPAESFYNSAQILAVINKTVIEMNSNCPAPQNLPLSPETKSCPRAHQGLYNELVACQECTDEHVKITFPHVIYGYDPENSVIKNSFWASKKDLTPLNELNANLKSHIPHADYAHTPTIVLIYPWKNFSLGTRFTHVPSHDNCHSYAIAKIDYNQQSIALDFVPHENAIIEIRQSTQERKKLFASLINNLIDRVTASGKANIIPYVWGGSSFIEPYTDGNFYQSAGAWHRDCTNNPYSGYDCSELVMRIAQIAGIDFPWKTSTAIQRALTEICPEDSIQNGDLIWVPGHVMIISNSEKNELIEARGYSSGYGCVHRITLDECFADITTYDDLRTHFKNGTPIQFKDRNGNVLEKKHPVQILKLAD